MRTTRLMLTLKMEAVEFLEQSGNVRKTTRKFGFQPWQIQKLREISSNQGRARKNHQKLTAHSGTFLENPNLEESLYDLAMENRLAEHSTSSIDDTDKDISPNPKFQNGTKITLRN